jgi:hypothetical protein
MDQMEFQHVNVKLFVKNAEGLDLEALISVFHSWIQDQGRGERLLDVADYRHVSSGPGVVLIGHEGNYSLDNSGGRLGVRYNRKAALERTNQDRLVQATQSALTACRRLETDPRLGGRIQFNGREIEVSINDRLLAPNTADTHSAAISEFRTLFSTLFGDIKYTVTYPQDPRSVFSVQVTTSQLIDTTALLDNLRSLAPALN